MASQACIDTGPEVERVPLRNGPSIASESGEAEWIVETRKALQGLQNLPLNWNERGAQAISGGTISRAFWLLVTNARFHTPAPDVIPTPGGGVQFEWHRCRMDIEIEVPPRGQSAIYVRDRDANIEIEEELANNEFFMKPSSTLIDMLTELTERHLRSRQNAR